MGAARLWRRHAEARMTLEIYYSKRLYPIFATWDDHDFGKNDAGKQFPYVPEAHRWGGREVFEIDHKQEISKGGGVYDIDNMRVMSPKQHVERHRTAE